MRPKVTIVGAGATGGAMAQRMIEKGYCDVVLQDVPEFQHHGKALDLAQSAPLLGFSGQVVATDNWEETAGSQVVVLTAGAPRTPGMTREDLLNNNARIVREKAENAVKYSPDAVFIVFANPMDAMCHVTLKATGLPPERVIGQGGMLDSARFRTFIAWELGVSPRDVHAYVLGGHTEATMVPCVSLSSVAGVPLTALLPRERIEALVERTRNGGAEVVNLLRTGSAFYAPSAATVEMIEAILLDQKRVLPCACYLQGQYGIHDAYVGVLAVLGAGGRERIIEAPLTEEERAGMLRAAQAVKELIGLLV